VKTALMRVRGAARVAQVCTQVQKTTAPGTKSSAKPCRRLARYRQVFDSARRWSPLVWQAICLVDVALLRLKKGL
jgi:hypothetical protein